MNTSATVMKTEVGTEIAVDIDELRSAFSGGKCDDIGNSLWVVLRLVTWSDDVGAWVLTAKGSEVLASTPGQPTYEWHETRSWHYHTTPEMRSNQSAWLREQGWTVAEIETLHYTRHLCSRTLTATD